MNLPSFDEHWQAVERHYYHTVRVHDLGGGQKEVLVLRGDVYQRPTPEFRTSYAEKSAEDQRADSIDRAARRAKCEVRRRCKAMGMDSLLTLTYKANQTDEALCKEHMKEFVRRIRRVIPVFLYVAAFERQERGAWHIHMAVRRVQSHFMDRGVRVKSFELIRAIWRSVVGELGGNIDLQRKKANARKTVAQLAAYLSKYMVKAYADGEFGSQRWTASRFKVPKAARFWINHENIKDIIARLVAEHAPAGTQIRCCLIGHSYERGFFMTVEPSSPSLSSA